MSEQNDLLTAFIKAQGYDIKRVRTGHVSCDCFKSNPASQQYMSGCQRCQGTGILHGTFNYEVTKSKFNSKPTLHKIIRQYEKEGMTASEMIGRIMLLEGITNEDL